MEKPKSIKVFDTLFAAAFVLGIGALVLSWTESLEYLRADPNTAAIAAGLMIALAALSFGLDLLLWYCISRRRSNAARRILAALTIMALVWVLVDPATYVQDVETALLSWSTDLLWLAQVVCLYLPDSRRWFRGDNDRQSIRDTFG